MRIEELDYELDPQLIATRPVEPRDAARLLVLGRTPGPLEHRRVDALAQLLQPGDALVLNETRVVPARVRFHRPSTGGGFEGLVLPSHQPDRIGCYLKGAKKLHAGDRLELRNADQQTVGVLEVLGREAEQVMLRLVEGGSLDTLLEAAGEVPLPPYILGARRDRGEADDPQLDRQDRAWYRTVYQAAAGQRSVAAPTAGLHFTSSLLEALTARGIELVRLQLEVGPGTFKPVTADRLEEHPMHRERFVIEADARSRLQAVRAAGGRIIAVGTTSCRALESLPDTLAGETLAAETDLMIAPGYSFRHVDGLMTNFHLPRSTLLALVAAMVGLERLIDVYMQAIAQRYRFYSYGDAMLIR